MAEDIAFEDKGEIEIPEKGDIREEKMVADVTKSIKKSLIKDKIEEKEGVKKEPVGTMTKDVPQLLFKIAAKAIPCKNFELNDDEAQTFAAHLNILIPLSGKITSLVILVMITLNKVYGCMDAIQAKVNRANVEEKAERVEKSEVIQ